jgi:hypothetical protein
METQLLKVLAILVYKQMLSLTLLEQHNASKAIIQIPKVNA